ncbi:MAG: NTP transferase domain-containing protein [Proteobacteria bacterium]|nr:NTP transferase domain-containing protein [Pseudomonadota bacterium]
MSDSSTLTSNGSLPYCAVICAAGAGTRMGHNKALCRLPHSGTFLSSIVNTLQAAEVTQIVVVIGAQANEVIQAHPDLHVNWVVNPLWANTFMLESLTCGIQHTPKECNIIHWPVDCVGVHLQDLQKLLTSPLLTPFAALSFHGKSGHPLRIAPQAADILRSGNHTFHSLREFFHSGECTYIEADQDALMNCNDPQRLADFIATHAQL